MKHGILLLSLSFAVILGGCGRVKPEKPLSYRIAVIPKGTTHEFWEAIHAGAIKAEQELQDQGLPVEITWKGPLREDDREFQIQVVESFAATGYNGIVLAPLDDTALVAPVELAARSQTPVVIIDSGLNTDQYVSFVATDNSKGGEMAGDYMAQLLGEEGEVMLLRYQEGSASTSKREEGFLRAIAKYEGIKVVSQDQYGGATMDAAYQKAENLLSRPELANVQGIFCPNETVTVALTKALREVNKARGKVKVIGFDTSRQSLLDLENGDVQGLIVQNPVAMGYMGVRTIVAHLQGATIEKRVDTGVTLVTAEVMNEPAVQDLLNPPSVDDFTK